MTGPGQRVAVVTGGAGAIDASIVAALAAAGHQAIILDQADRAVARLSGGPERAFVAGGEIVLRLRHGRDK
jgi:NAD(P)-dependent dehydrogenase (short-subunit alcohol dehydrogenase family)